MIRSTEEKTMKKAAAITSMFLDIGGVLLAWPAHARAAVQTLNDAYRDARPCIFYLFHRPRVWNPIERHGAVNIGNILRKIQASHR